MATTPTKRAPATKARSAAKKAVRTAVRATGTTAPAKKAARKSSPANRRNGSALARRVPAGPDAIALLKEDHRKVEKLFKAFEKAGDTAYRTKSRIVGDIVTELSGHAAIEEQFFYPAVRRQVPKANDDVLEAMEEHHVAKWILSELTHMNAEDERFDAKVTVLIESVRHHVREEEHELFPEVRSAIGRKDLLELGARLKEGKKLAPKRPHPRSPDEPPSNLIVGAAAGVVDRVRTAVTSK